VAKIKKVRKRSYINRDFDSFRAEILDYARAYFSDKIQDFSEASMGGLLLDMAAHVGDTMSFYLDHQFNELDPNNAVELRNIERHIKNAGVAIAGAAPAVVDVTFFIEVASDSTEKSKPFEKSLPIIRAGSKVSSKTGIIFQLIENIDFNEKDSSGKLTCGISVSSRDANNEPKKFILTQKASCVSGDTTTDKFNIPNTHQPFRRLTLSNTDVSEIIKVKDSDNNVYYEVDSLTQNTVFQAITNISPDGDIVKDNLQLLPAPYRFTSEMSLKTGLTTLIFGSGDADSLDDDIVPDPSELSIPLHGKKQFKRFTLDPGDLLKTKTLGVSPKDTIVTVDYRYGGGLSHNVPAGSIVGIRVLDIIFPGDPDFETRLSVKQSVDISNKVQASGGEDAPTVQELKDKVIAFRNMQSRIVTKKDLLARVYTLPTNFGRVFRAGIRPHPNNPLTSQLFIISRNQNGVLITSPDALKENLSKYLNEFRIVNDSIEILDAPIVDFNITFKIVVDPTLNHSAVLKNIFADLKNRYRIVNFQIDQPIIISEIRNMIFNIDGVISIIDINVRNVSGVYKGRQYGNFSIKLDNIKGIIPPPPGGIFQMRYPDFDLIGSAI
jgi:hypothetical protein